MNDLAKWTSVLPLDWLQVCFSIEEIVLTIHIKESLEIFVD